MSTDRAALATPDALDGRPVQGARRMYRYVVPVDDRPHLVLLTSSPVRVDNGRTLEEVEFWAVTSGRQPSGTPLRIRTARMRVRVHPAKQFQVSRWRAESASEMPNECSRSSWTGQRAR